MGPQHGSGHWRPLPPRYFVTVVTVAASTPLGKASAPAVVWLTTISLATVKVTDTVADTSDEGLM
ncbi:hypothetical protein D3C78_1944200 [compost metagenome]